MQSEIDMKDALPIIKYIEYLNRTHNLFISVHTRADLKLIFNDELSVLSLHRNPYCAFVKSQKNMHINCVKCQQKALRVSEKGSYCGFCYAGVFEYVYPIFNNDNVVAMISVSGYGTLKGESKSYYFAEKYGLCIDEVLKMYRTLNFRLPKKCDLDVLIVPLCKMLELEYIKQPVAYVEKDLYNSVLNYVEKEHTNPITLESICHQFNYSKSHISHIFKSNSGVSLREYINELRIKDACYLLKNSNMSVSEVAFSVGFSDASYFIVVFKKIIGKTPVQYRCGLT